LEIFITGATGFIGTALLTRLLKDGNKVTVLTRDEEKVDASFKKKVDILKADICDLASLEKLSQRLQNIDAVLHLAASLNYFEDKNRLSRTNVEGALNILKLVEKNKINKFIFTSSIEAMGPVEENDILADENFVCEPVSPYGESKLEAEIRIRKFAKENKLAVMILRLGNVYGPGSQAFITPIANAILRKDKLFKFLSVYKNRYLHLVYIEDVIDGIITALQSNSMDETYILAGQKYITVGTLFELVAQSLNVDMNLPIKDRSAKDELYLNLRKRIHRFLKRADLITYFMAGDNQRVHRAYSIEKAKRELGFSPKVSLKEGISKTLEWTKKEGFLVK